MIEEPTAFEPEEADPDLLDAADASGDVSADDGLEATEPEGEEADQ
jgi:hypothetical protein